MEEFVKNVVGDKVIIVEDNLSPIDMMIVSLMNTLVKEDNKNML